MGSQLHSRIGGLCFLTACTLAAVLCIWHGVQSAEIDEVSNIVEMVSFVIVEGGGLVNIDSGSSDLMI